MRINLDFEYDKLHLKEITILIPKYHHNLVSFLTPVLGLYGINVKEFITEFELKTRFINFDVTIPVRVRISKIKTFQISIRTPYIISILSNIPDFSLPKSSLSALTVYKLTLLKSVFGNYALTHQRLIYSSIRKYLSKIIKASLLPISDVKIANNISIFHSDVLEIKNISHNILFFKKLIVEKYGSFVTFNNASGAYMGYLKTSLSLLNLSITKINAKLLSSLTNNRYFYGSIYYISGKGYNQVINLFQQLISKKTLRGSLFAIYYRFGLNLLTPTFAKLVFTSFSNLSSEVVLLKLLNRLLLNNIRSLNLVNKKILFLMNYRVNNANLSSNLS